MIKTSLIFLIKAYKLILSPIFGPSCRYLPTCSDYFIDCLNEYGIFNGTAKGVKRIFSCHPFGGHGYDPVKKDKS
tara:strand:- start:490 stop:714 length:225 start_codon:yes stop_codon:yes gene_type:complete